MLAFIIEDVYIIIGDLPIVWSLTVRLESSVMLPTMWYQTHVPFLEVQTHGSERTTSSPPMQPTHYYG